MTRATNGDKHANRARRWRVFITKERNKESNIRLESKLAAHGYRVMKQNKRPTTHPDLGLRDRQRSQNVPFSATTIIRYILLMHGGDRRGKVAVDDKDQALA